MTDQADLKPISVAELIDFTTRLHELLDGHADLSQRFAEAMAPYREGVLPPDPVFRLYEGYAGSIDQAFEKLYRLSDLFGMQRQHVLIDPHADDADVMALLLAIDPTELPPGPMCGLVVTALKVLGHRHMLPPKIQARFTADVEAGEKRRAEAEASKEASLLQTLDADLARLRETVENEEDFDLEAAGAEIERLRGIIEGVDSRTTDR